MTTKPAISARQVVKTFVGPRPLSQVLANPFGRRRISALAGVDLECRSGELLALVGPNGSGKTTLLKVLCTLVLPDAGQAAVAGLDVKKDAARVRRTVGLVNADERSFYWRLSGRHNLEFFAALHGLPAREARARASELLERVDLAASANAPFREYSTGMRQKLALCRGLLHHPSVLLLDEPTRGIDLPALRNLRALLKEHAAAGGAALLASHDLGEIETLDCPVALLFRGRVTAQGSIASLRTQLGIADTVEIELASGDAATLATRLAAAPFVAGAAAEGDRLIVRLTGEAVIGEVIAALQTAGGRVSSVRPRGAALEAVLDAVHPPASGTR